MKKRVRYLAGSFTNFRILLILLLAASMFLILLPGCAGEDPEQAEPGYSNGQDPVKPSPDANLNNGQETNNNGETYNEQAIAEEVSDLVESLVLISDLEGFLLPVIEGGKFSLINLAGEIVLTPHRKVGIYDAFPFGGSPLRPPVVYVDADNPLLLSLSTAYGPKAAVLNSRGELVAYYDSMLKGGQGYIVERGGKEGFVNNRGELIIDINYDYISATLSDKLVEVRAGNGFGFANTETGEVVIEPVYDDAWASGGVIFLKKGVNSFLFDEAGEEIARLAFDQIEYPSEGMIAVRKGARWGFINLKGELIVAPAFEKVDRFSKGFAAVKKDGKWGFIDREGRFLVEPQFDEVGRFGQQAFFRDGAERGYLDRSGNIIIRGAFEHITCSVSGKYYFFWQDGKIGITDSKNVIVEPDFNDYIDSVGTCDFTAVYIAGDCPTVWKRDEPYCAVFIESRGEISNYIYKPVVDLWWPVAFRYSGIAQMITEVKGMDGAGLLNVETGKFIIAPGKYESFGYLRDGLAYVKQDGKYGFVNEAGRVVIDFRFDQVSIFIEGVAAVREGDKIGYIDRDGRYIVSPMAVGADGIWENTHLEELELKYFEDAGVFRGSGYCYFYKAGNIIRKPS